MTRNQLTPSVQDLLLNHPRHGASTLGRLFLVGAAIVLALAGTVSLWAYYGATVFFETIRTGLMACFG